MSSSFLDLESNHFVGYLTELTYDTATIMSHDFHVANADFVPKGAFLIVQVNSKKKDEEGYSTFAYFLLRVLNISYIDKDSKFNKETTIQKHPTPSIEIIDFQQQINDPVNQNKLAFYQLNCNLLGTFFEDNGKICFGSDVYSFNVGHIYKVYKPINGDLAKIVNFVKEDRLKATYDLFKNIGGQDKIDFNIESLKFNIGKVRYASTLIKNYNSEIVKPNIAEVNIYPSDFIKQKTGIFGMTRTGKSNTVKIIAKSIMNLSETSQVPIGQLIYDINGEYANDNEQNTRLTNNNLYTVDVDGLKETHFKDFNPALNNFYLNPNYGLNVIQKDLRTKDSGSNYMNVFLSIKNIDKDPLLFIFWILLLYKAGYDFPTISAQENISIYTKENGNINSGDILYYKKGQIFAIFLDKNLFNQYADFFNHFQVRDNGSIYALGINEESLKKILHKYLNNKQIIAGQDKHPLYDLIIKNNSEYELHYLSLLGFILQEDRSSGKKYSTSGWQIIVPYKFSHCSSAFLDYRTYIYNELINGKTVIIDFSIGDPFTRKYIADELMEFIFTEQIKTFRKSNISKNYCPVINIFIEEAHNVIGKGASIDSLWPRIAKEGAKYNIGLLYATQEPSAIHESILANTANFIVAHLNNEKEINTISQYEDLGDFKESIKKAEDVGFVRLRLLSKPYTVPVQIDKF